MWENSMTAMAWLNLTGKISYFFFFGSEASSWLALSLSDSLTPSQMKKKYLLHERKQHDGNGLAEPDW